MHTTVELRSDTFTKPCEGMRKAMYNADVGDAMYGEDKTVQRLEEAVAGLLGKEEGLFGASGELIGLLIGCVLRRSRKQHTNVRPYALCIINH